ncbi:hypothetical protein [Oceanicoccus sagamiensis]|uniref:Uncharacterized protein n=1 Tax=Oceanicoccus sagamiensis TaxID=716816 RepID=A0A1X9NFI6_9GAMM|nr:hypothetical protein [Oceanicoccus sagamiensis]ARN75941.1 hypothetical protein BST96_18670 [Oceanicoccus sagamiensis]
MSSNSKTTKVILAISAFIILLAFTTAVLYLTINQKKKTTFFARSINDASYDCEDKITSKYEGDLVSKSFDNISSRYEPDKRQYTIYYRISIKEKDENFSIVNDYMAKCIVWERLGYVSDFRVFTY